MTIYKLTELCKKASYYLDKILFTLGRKILIAKSRRIIPNLYNYVY